MLIYGLFLMGLCMLFGIFVGDIAGLLVALGVEGFKGNVGGVGFAMLFLILITNHLKSKGKFSIAAESGVKFWSAFYIPVVVAMSASQNVVSALNGGWVALIAGVGATVLMFYFIKPLSRLMTSEPLPEISAAEKGDNK